MGSADTQNPIIVFLWYQIEYDRFYLEPKQITITKLMYGFKFHHPKVQKHPQVWRTSVEKFMILNEPNCRNYSVAN